ncbi:MAG TPA: aldose epimerase family protein [Candidatus Binatia bacterium]|nr:aldose epimerase family protein [Candidatus Binatia bacterium]
MNRLQRTSVIAALAFSMAGCATTHMSNKPLIEEIDFGRMPDGRVVKRYELRNRHGMSARIISYGAILTELQAPDRNGAFTNVVHGFSSFRNYIQGHPFFGATVGRVSNRIGKARFTLDGQEYPLASNNGSNHLHGGMIGFDKVLWKAQPIKVDEREVAVVFSYLSRDGEEGYPGNLDVRVTYTLTDNNELRIDYSASADKATPVNITNHSYFNLAGSGDVLGYEMFIAADRYTPVDDELIPTGEIAPVKGTPLDFTTPELIGTRIEQLKPKPGGYDHNYVLNSEGKSLALAARVREPKSGRVMEVLTTEPGIQLYTGNFLQGQVNGLNGQPSERHSGFCLETQHFPDSVNHTNFPSTILRPGKTYKSTTVYRFSTG